VLDLQQLQLRQQDRRVERERHLRHPRRVPRRPCRPHHHLWCWYALLLSSRSNVISVISCQHLPIATEAANLPDQGVLYSVTSYAALAYVNFVLPTFNESYTGYHVNFTVSTAGESLAELGNVTFTSSTSCILDGSVCWCSSVSLSHFFSHTLSLLGSCVGAIVRAAGQRLDLHREPLARSWHVAIDLAQLFVSLSSVQRPVDRDARRRASQERQLVDHDAHHHRLGGGSRCRARVADRRCWCRVVHEAKPFVRLHLSNVARLSLSCGGHLRQQAWSHSCTHTLLHSFTHSLLSFDFLCSFVSDIQCSCLFSFTRNHSCNEPTLQYNTSTHPHPSLRYPNWIVYYLQSKDDG